MERKSPLNRGTGDRPEDELSLIQRELGMVLEAEQDEDDDAEFYSIYFDSTRNEMVGHCDHKGKLRNFAKFRKFPYSA